MKLFETIEERFWLFCFFNVSAGFVFYLYPFVLFVILVRLGESKLVEKEFLFLDNGLETFEVRV